MRCKILNPCEDRKLCCNFCTTPRCPNKCKDDHTRCKYFVNAMYEREEPPQKPEKRKGVPQFPVKKAKKEKKVFPLQKLTKKKI